MSSPHDLKKTTNRILLIMVISVLVFGVLMAVIILTDYTRAERPVTEVPLSMMRVAAITAR